eukprot:m.117246 g.117246  ORF g.117246 m.117246 type:complete len:250 (-) comp9204_c1_seq3:136-885(-)
MSRMAQAEVFYRGYVHVDCREGALPSLAVVQKAAALLKEKNQKTARAMHPLFARGLDTPLQLEVSDAGLKVSIKDGAVVMNNQLHKVAFVLDLGSFVCFIVKRASHGKFNCHGFEVGTAKQANVLAMRTAELCNELFSKARRVSHRVKRRAAPKPPGKTAEEIQEAVKMTSEMAETDAKAIQEAIQELGDGKDEPITPAPAGSVTVNFISEVSDKLAQLLTGQNAESMASFELDDEMFNFGEINGEVDC